jgi:hypothetical protein
MNIRRQFRWVAVILGAVLLIAIIAVLVTGTNNTTITARQKAAGCNAGPADNTMPTASPTDFDWKNLGAITVPVSATYGPTKFNGDLWTCYRHDPMGAVFATYDILAASVSPQWHQVAEAQFVPGSGQQAYIAAGEQQTIAPLQPGQVVQLHPARSHRRRAEHLRRHWPVPGRRAERRLVGRRLEASGQPRRQYRTRPATGL